MPAHDCCFCWIIIFSPSEQFERLFISNTTFFWFPLVVSGSPFISLNLVHLLTYTHIFSLQYCSPFPDLESESFTLSCQILKHLQLIQRSLIAFQEWPTQTPNKDHQLHSVPSVLNPIPTITQSSSPAPTPSTSLASTITSLTSLPRQSHSYALSAGNPSQPSGTTSAPLEPGILIPSAPGDLGAFYGCYSGLEWIRKCQYWHFWALSGKEGRRLWYCGGKNTRIGTASYQNLV